MVHHVLVNLTLGRLIWRAEQLLWGYDVIIDIKISVDADITVEEGHRVARVVKQTLLKNHEEVMDVNVHVNPY